MNCVLKHNPFNLASKITVFIKFSNNAKKTKIVNKKMPLSLNPEADSTGNRILEFSSIPNGSRFR